MSFPPRDGSAQGSPDGAAATFTDVVTRIVVQARTKRQTKRTRSAANLLARCLETLLCAILPLDSRRQSGFRMAEAIQSLTKERIRNEGRNCAYAGWSGAR